MADWEYYKIADSPLDIVGKTLKVVTSLSDTPIITSDWRNDEGGTPTLKVQNDEPYIREEVIVLNNYSNSSNYFATNGTPPLSGIFVSENIRSISIAESEEVHQIESKYINTAPCIIFNSNPDDIGVNFYGIAYFSARGGDEPREASLSVSDGSEILGIYNKSVLDDTHNAGDFGELDFDNSGKLYFYPGENEGSQLELYEVVVGNQEDITSAKVLPLIIHFQTTGLPD